METFHDTAEKDSFFFQLFQNKFGLRKR